MGNNFRIGALSIECVLYMQIERAIVGVCPWYMGGCGARLARKAQVLPMGLSNNMLPLLVRHYFSTHQIVYKCFITSYSFTLLKTTGC